MAIKEEKEANEKRSKLKGKHKKIAKAKMKAEDAVATPESQENGSDRKNVVKTAIKNYGCCCTCSHFPHKKNKETQPCKVFGNYVARKAKMKCYKCKFD